MNGRVDNVEAQLSETSGASVSHQPQRLHLELMDGFNLGRAGSSLLLPGAVQRLVAFLALRESRSLERSFIAGKLWFETGHGRAAANLRSALCRLRQCDPALVDVSGSSLRLGAEVSVDVTERSAIARRVLASPNDFSDLDYRELLQGELLPNWHDDWVVFERERIRQLRLHALEVVAERLTAQSRYGEAVEVALAALREEPLRGSAHQVLIGAYLAEGNVIEAARDYSRFEELLKRRFGLDPSERLQGLVNGFADARRAIRTGEAQE